MKRLSCRAWLVLPAMLLVSNLTAVAVTQEEVAISAVLAQPGRLPEDIARDTRSRPERILPLLQLKPGDQVADIFGGSGYYSDLLAAPY